MAITFFAIIGSALYRASKSSPALAEKLKKFVLDLRNQIRLKQASTMVQIMDVVSRLSLHSPSLFQLSFTFLIILVSWPFSFQPPCLEFVYVPTSFQGFSLFTLTQALIYFLLGLYGYKRQSNRLSKDFCRSMQIVAGLLHICSALILLASKLRAVELKDRILKLSGTPEEAFADVIELFIEGSLQGLFVIIEATIMNGQLKNWSRECAKLEEDYRTGDDGLKAIMETEEYQLKVSIEGDQ